MAVLTALEMKCTRYKVREDVMDQIVQEGGLEYATDVIIHLQQIDIEWDYANNVIIILPSGIHLATWSNIPDLNDAYVNIYH